MVPVFDSRLTDWYKKQNGCEKLKYMGYPSGGYNLDVPNFIFEAKLKFEGFTRGRSSVKAIFSCMENKDIDVTYEMFISDFGDIIKANVIKKGVLKGKFAFRKAGANYGLYMLEKEATFDK